MTIKIVGKFKTLKSMVKLAGVAGKWRRGENHYQFRANTGAVLNWWKSTGTVTFQGPEEPKAHLKAAFLKHPLKIGP